MAEVPAGDQEAWERAAGLLEAGDFAGVLDLMAPVAARHPDAAGVWYLMGVAHFKSGSPRDAIDALMKAASLDDRRPEVWRNLGEAFDAAGAWSSAIEAYLLAVTHAPQSLSHHLMFLACVARTLKDTPVLADVVARWAITFAGGDGIGDAYAELDRLFGDGADWFHRLVFLHMSAILLRLGHHEDSIAAYTRFALPADDNRAMPDADGVKEGYRGLAATYDRTLGAEVAGRMAVFVREVAGGRKGLRLLDVCCGTGLMGVLLADLTDTIVGIDLSPEMIAEAAAKGVYDELVTGDAAAVLAGRTDTFDLVTCSGALYHIPDLAGFFAGAAARLRSGGILAFSLDPCSDAWEVGLTWPDNYCHSRRYVRRLAAENGLHEIDIRILEHRAHPGFFCAFRKPGDTPCAP